MTARIAAIASRTAAEAGSQVAAPATSATGWASCTVESSSAPSAPARSASDRLARAHRHRVGRQPARDRVEHADLERREHEGVALEPPERPHRPLEDRVVVGAHEQRVVVAGRARLALGLHVGGVGERLGAHQQRGHAVRHGHQAQAGRGRRHGLLAPDALAAAGDHEPHAAVRADHRAAELGELGLEHLAVERDAHVGRRQRQAVQVRARGARAAVVDPHALEHAVAADQAVVEDQGRVAVRA